MKGKPAFKKSSLSGTNLRLNPRLNLGGSEKWESLWGASCEPFFMKNLFDDVQGELFIAKNTFGSQVRMKRGLREVYGLSEVKFKKVCKEVSKDLEKGFGRVELRTSYFLWRIGFVLSQKIGDWAVRLGYVWVEKKGGGREICRRGRFLRSEGDRVGLTKEGRQRMWMVLCWHWRGKGESLEKSFLEEGDSMEESHKSWGKDERSLSSEVRKEQKERVKELENFPDELKEMEYPAVVSFAEMDYERIEAEVRWVPQDGEVFLPTGLMFDWSVFQKR